MDILSRALIERQPLLDADPVHKGALRLFNGFIEGLPGLAVDLYADALLLHNQSQLPRRLDAEISRAVDFYRSRLPWLSAGLLKTRRSPDAEERRGRVLFGDALPRKVSEHGVWYALDLRLNQDASLYLDTRSLRAWLIAHSAGQRVLNTFAYTGSLGAACLAGGARQVLQLDLNRQFLNLANETYALNGFAVQRADLVSADFFVYTAQLRRTGALFDLILLDPPFFSETRGGRVDLVAESERLVNKIRPLAADGGRIVVINNALFLSGKEFLAGLERLGADGFLTLEEIVPVAEDFSGFPSTSVGQPPADPAPFNHSTKIAVLRVKRK